MLTNWNTISKSIKRLEEVESVFWKTRRMVLTEPKEQLRLLRSRDKLRADLGESVRWAVCRCDRSCRCAQRKLLLFLEANKLGVPVIAVCDSNADPDGIDYVIQEMMMPVRN